MRPGPCGWGVLFLVEEFLDGSTGVCWFFVGSGGCQCPAAGVGRGTTGGCDRDDGASGDGPGDTGACELEELVSGVYSPGAGYGSAAKRTSHRYMVGMLKAGNIQMEIHETIQEVGAVHEPTDKHLHNEIWLVKEGVC